MNELEKMLSGELYDPNDSVLLELRRKCHRLCHLYNQTLEEEVEKRTSILNELGMKMGENVYLQGPIYFDYGCFISFGNNSYANFNLTILDICKVTIGDNVFIGPNVSIVAALHPLSFKERNLYMSEKGCLTDREYGKPITIEDNCWIGSNVTILPGVTIGEGSVIGAGSVVTKSIPKNSLAYGNPCRVAKTIDQK